MQWVVNAYALIFGVLIVTGGRLADMFGRATDALVGAGIFAVFSLLGGLAPNVGMLIVARALHGHRRRADVAGHPRARLRHPPRDKAGLAGGLVIGMAGIGNAAGRSRRGAGRVGGLAVHPLRSTCPSPWLAIVVTWLTVHVRGTPSEPIDYAGIATVSIEPRSPAGGRSTSVRTRGWGSTR